MCSTEKITKTLTQNIPTEPYIISQDGRTVVYKPLEKSLEEFLKSLGSDDLYFTIPEILNKDKGLYYVEAEEGKNTACVMSFIRHHKELKSFPNQPLDQALIINIARIFWQRGKTYKDNIDDFDAILCTPCYVREKAYILRPHPEGDKLYLVYAARSESGKNQLYRETVTRDKLIERLNHMRFYQYFPLKIIERNLAYKATSQPPVSFDPQKAAQAMCSFDRKLSGIMNSSDEALNRSLGFGCKRSQ